MVPHVEMWFGSPETLLLGECRQPQGWGRNQSWGQEEEQQGDI